MQVSTTSGTSFDRCRIDQTHSECPFASVDVASLRRQWWKRRRWVCDVFSHGKKENGWWKKEGEERGRGCREREKGKRERWPAPEEYKFMSMQHKVASTTSQAIHTHLHPLFGQLSNSASRRFPDRLFDTRPGVPIDLGSLKTRGNHRRQLLRAPLSGTSRGYVHVRTGHWKGAFLRVDVAGTWLK